MKQYFQGKPLHRITASGGILSTFTQVPYNFEMPLLYLGISLLCVFILFLITFERDILYFWYPGLKITDYIYSN